MEESPRPYIGISTADAESIIAITRNQLDKYQRKGIVSPLRSSPSPQAMYTWTFEQTWMASQIPELISHELTIDEAKELADRGMDQVYEQLKTSYLSDTRRSRRMLKSIVLYESIRRDYQTVGRRSDSYLRHIPERWLALAPLDPGHEVAPADDLARRTTALLGVAQTVGWCVTKVTGIIASISADGSSSTSYAFAQLASPPMPAYTGARVVDGGCYHAFDEDRASLRCDDPDCPNCSRFGRAPTARESFDWRGEADLSPWLWDRTVMAADIEEPYASGVWSQYTRERLARQRAFFPTRRGEMEIGPSLRPRLMPHEVKLPFGVTACALPAGVHLCCQSEDASVRSSFQRFLGRASVFRQKPFTLEDEKSAATRTTKPKGADAVENGPVMEHFAQFRDLAGEKEAHWSRDITRPELSRLVVPTMMALFPEDGYCVVCSTIPPSDRNQIPDLELQLLVDCSEIIAPPPTA